MAKRPCHAKVRSLIRLYLLGGKIAGISIHLIELEMPGQIHFGLQENEVSGVDFS